MAYWGWKNDPSAGDEVFRQYIGKIVDIVRRLRERDLDVLLLIGDSTDLVAVEAAVERLAPYERPGVSVAPIENYDDVIRCTAQTDATIVTRYHGLVAALLTNRPTVSIGYAEKNAEIMNGVGLGAYCHGIDAFDVDAVLDDVERVRTEWHERGPEVAKVVSKWAEQIDDLFIDAVRYDHG